MRFLTYALLTLFIGTQSVFSSEFSDDSLDELYGNDQPPQSTALYDSTLETKKSDETEKQSLASIIVGILEPVNIAELTKMVELQHIFREPYYVKNLHSDDL